MLQDELRQILRDLMSNTGASSASILHDRTLVDLESPPAAPRHLELVTEGQQITVPIGGGALLRARFPTEARGDERAAAMERASRALRACARRWEANTLPPLALPDQPATTRERVLDRIHDYLLALMASQGMINAALIRRGELIASAEPLTELQSERVPFTVRRVGVEAARRRGWSHADAMGEDYFAQSFYTDACLIAFFDQPYASDFVRYRVRLVTKELAHLLALLDTPPDDPASAAPIPE